MSLLHAMPDKTSEGDLAAGQVEVGAFFDGVLRRWRIVVSSMVLTLGLTMIWLFVAQPQYQVRMTIVRVADQDTSGGISSSAISQLSGLGGLARLALPSSSQGSSPFGRFRRILTSAALAERLDEKYDLMKTIYRDRWDETRQVWLPPSGVRAFFSIVLNYLIGQPTWSPPRPEIELAAMIQKNLTVSPDSSGDYISLYFRHPNREFAIAMLTRIHKEADDLIRERERLRIDNDLTYLRARFEETANISYRELFLEQLAALEQRRMVLQAGRAFSAEIFDGPIAPYQPSHPRPLLYSILAIGFGFVAGVLIAIIHAGLTGNRYQPTWPGLALWRSLRSRMFNGHRHIQRPAKKPGGRPV